MRPFPQRVLVACFATLFGTLAGAAAGYMLGRTVSLRQTQFRIAHYADLTVDDVSSSTRESRAVLGKMSASSNDFCSDAEIGYFRQLIFQSRYLKEAGRIRNGKVDCSTTLGRAPAPQLQLKPDVTQKDGALIYRNLPLFRIGDLTVITVQLGDSYVVYSPYNSGVAASPHMHATLSDVDASTRATGTLFGDLPQIEESLLTRDGQARLKDNVYATRCSTVGTACVTAYMSVDEALAASRPALMGFALLGALAGGLLGFLCSLIYRRKKSLQHQLLRAIRSDALTVVYQPIVDLETGRIVEAEALVRWTDDDNQPVSPDVFVKIAEEKGFVSEITKLVVRRVLREFGPSLRAFADFRININIAASDLADPAFLPMLQDSLAHAGVRPENIAIEITESYTARQQVAKETILRLRERGHYVYIDDFGTGYSSLAYLHDLSVDAIKIDKAFTRAIGTDAVTVSILPQILSMANQLGLRVIVEGIETQEQARYFAAADQSIHAQGWLFGHPIPVDAFHQLLLANYSNREVLDRVIQQVVVPARVQAHYSY